MRIMTLSVGLGTTVVLACCAMVSGINVAVASEPTPAVVTSGPLRFEEHLIMDKYAYPYGIAAADLDGDGDLDLTSADAKPHNSLYWHENDGKGRFKRHFIQKDDPERLERHAIGDVDRDGRPDVVIVKNLFGDLLWFRNSGDPKDGKLWRRHVITKGTLPGAYRVALADLDGDGDLDVAASSWVLGNQFAWFENDGSPADGQWKKHLIEGNVAETRTIWAADVDGDGDPDLVGSATVGNLVVWYENSGKPATEPWKKHVIDEAAFAAMHGCAVDMDGDGDVDVLMAMGFAAPERRVDALIAMGLGSPELRNQRTVHQVVWYENDGTPARGDWNKHVIAEPFPSAFEAVAEDLDDDGDLDVVATAFSTGQVVWFENHGDPKGRWSMHLIKDNWTNACVVITADLDGDGKLDIAACAERGSLEFRWWRNLGRNTN